MPGLLAISEDLPADLADHRPNVALCSSIIFAVFNLTPTVRNGTVLEPCISWNYTTILNLIFLVLAAITTTRQGLVKASGRATTVNSHRIVLTAK